MTRATADSLAMSMLALPVSKSVSSLSFMQLGDVCLVIVVCCAVGYPSVECHYYAYEYVCHDVVFCNYIVLLLCFSDAKIMKFWQ